MYRKYFFKNKGVLSRKFVASGLAAVFSAGMFGSYAGAMEPGQNFEPLSSMNEKLKPANVLDNNSIRDDDENAKEVFKFFIKFYERHNQLPKQDLMWVLLRYDVKNGNVLLKDEDFLIRLYAYLLLLKFYEFKDKERLFRIDDFLEKVKSGSSTDYFFAVNHLGDDYRINLLKKIRDGWGENLLKEVKEEVKKEKSEEYEQKIINTNSQNESTNEYELDKNIKIVVSVAIIFLVIFFAIKLAGKSKTNTGVPNNNKDDEKVNPSIEPEKDKDDEKVNTSIEPEKGKDDEKVNPSIEPEKDKDDEKVNPSIEPEKDKDDEKINPSIEPEKDKDDEKMNPSTDPESNDQNPEQDNQEEKPSVVPSNILSDNQNTEQNNQEERPSVVPSNILKATGATVTAGTLAGGTYLFNKVLKSGKPSEVKNSRNVDDKYMYLDSDGNKVTKTEEGKEIHNSDGTKNKGIGDSDAKQYLEDKDVEKTEEEQEEILDSPDLSNDTEATSDEDKNKD